MGGGPGGAGNNIYNVYEFFIEASIEQLCGNVSVSKIADLLFFPTGQGSACN